MQTPEAGTGSTSTVPLQTTVPGQPTASSQQAQTVQQVQHVYPAQVQYVEETSGIYTNGTIRTYTYTEPQLYSQNSGGSYFDTQAGSSQVPSVVVGASHGMTNNNNNNNGDGGGGGGGGGGNGVMGMGLAGGQVIDGSSGAYLIDTSAPHASGQATRASPATVSVWTPLFFIILIVIIIFISVGKPPHTQRP
ncbi:transcription factor RFX3 [Gadus macrocephalus]|uniref:transcription factor RFX3 n=1 Tax=Gadus macrocephalus TaxID=80720 RepID=UPI0028CBACA7|nr:transcription factor RFX3 [Gadus macrocephalus]